MRGLSTGRYIQTGVRRSTSDKKAPRVSWENKRVAHRTCASAICKTYLHSFHDSLFDASYPKTRRNVERVFFFSRRKEISSFHIKNLLPRAEGEKGSLWLAKGIPLSRGVGGMGNCTYNFFSSGLPSFGIFLGFLPTRFASLATVVSGYTWRPAGPRVFCVCPWDNVYVYVCICAVCAMVGTKVHGLRGHQRARIHVRRRPLSEYFLGSFLRTLTLSRTTWGVAWGPGKTPHQRCSLLIVLRPTSPRGAAHHGVCFLLLLYPRLGPPPRAPSRLCRTHLPKTTLSRRLSSNLGRHQPGPFPPTLLDSNPRNTKSRRDPQRLGTTMDSPEA